MTASDTSRDTSRDITRDIPAAPAAPAVVEPRRTVFGKPTQVWLSDLDGRLLTLRAPDDRVLAAARRRGRGPCSWVVWRTDDDTVLASGVTKDDAKRAAEAVFPFPAAQS